uniref:Uncharacterized protein n=1 Tax=Tetradesmus obliquus TaxID=3088 RepID=A0A383VTM2_TETOB
MLFDEPASPVMEILPANSSLAASAESAVLRLQQQQLLFNSNSSSTPLLHMHLGQAEQPVLVPAGAATEAIQANSSLAASAESAVLRLQQQLLHGNSSSMVLLQQHIGQEAQPLLVPELRYVRRGGMQTAAAVVHLPAVLPVGGVQQPLC